MIECRENLMTSLRRSPILYYNESMLELVNQIRMKNFDIALRSVLDSVPPSALVGDNEEKKCSRRGTRETQIRPVVHGDARREHGVEGRGHVCF